MHAFNHYTPNHVLRDPIPTVESQHFKDEIISGVNRSTLIADKEINTEGVSFRDFDVRAILDSGAVELLKAPAQFHRSTLNISDDLDAEVTRIQNS